MRRRSRLLLSVLALAMVGGVGFTGPTPVGAEMDAAIAGTARNIAAAQASSAASSPSAGTGAASIPPAEAGSPRTVAEPTPALTSTAWSGAAPSPSPGVSPQAGATPSAVPTETAAPTTTPQPTDGDLALTGARTIRISGLGGLLVAAGVVLLCLMRYRRPLRRVGRHRAA